MAQALGFAYVRARSHPAPGNVHLLDAHEATDCMTSIVRVPLAIATPAIEAVRALPGSSYQYVYPPGDVHLTVANLDDARVPPSELVGAIRRATHGTRTFPVQLRGLSMTSQSLYAQAWDPTGSLWRLRGRVATAAGTPLSVPRRLLGFVNVMRFASSDLTEIRAAVSRLKRVDFGSFDVGEVEVVRTDKVFAASSTTVLGRIQIGTTAPSPLR